MKGSPATAARDGGEMSSQAGIGPCEYNLGRLVTEHRNSKARALLYDIISIVWRQTRQERHRSLLRYLLALCRKKVPRKSNKYAHNSSSEIFFDISLGEEYHTIIHICADLQALSFRSENFYFDFPSNSNHTNMTICRKSTRCIFLLSALQDIY